MSELKNNVAYVVFGLDQSQINVIVARVLQDVCELPDYTSPPEQPELLQCTASELETILRCALGDDV